MWRLKAELWGRQWFWGNEPHGNGSKPVEHATKLLQIALIDYSRGQTQQIAPSFGRYTLKWSRNITALEK